MQELVQNQHCREKPYRFLLGFVSPWWQPQQVPLSRVAQPARRPSPLASVFQPSVSGPRSIERCTNDICSKYTKARERTQSFLFTLLLLDEKWLVTWEQEAVQRPCGEWTCWPPPAETMEHTKASLPAVQTTKVRVAQQAQSQHVMLFRYLFAGIPDVITVTDTRNEAFWESGQHVAECFDFTVSSPRGYCAAKRGNFLQRQFDKGEAISFQRTFPLLTEPQNLGWSSVRWRPRSLSRGGTRLFWAAPALSLEIESTQNCFEGEGNVNVKNL